jgi:CRP/FNR family transcriptional regulator, nitrogen oxide reductase regulator
MGARRSPITVEAADPASCTVDVRQHALGHVPFFADLSPDELAEVDRRCRVEDYAAGQAVLHEGQRASRLYVVATGTAKVVRPTLEGTEVLLDVARPGDFFGTLPALGSDMYTHSVWALTPMCVLSLDASSFDQILDANPSVARAGLRVVATRLERAHSHLHAMAAASSQQRIAAALVMLARRAGVERKDGLLLDLPLSRDDLASLTGTASETVSRVLAQMERDGLISTGRRWIEITDLPELEALSVI